MKTKFSIVLTTLCLAASLYIRDKDAFLGFLITESTRILRPPFALQVERLGVFEAVCHWVLRSVSVQVGLQLDLRFRRALRSLRAPSPTRDRVYSIFMNWCEAIETRQ